MVEKFDRHLRFESVTNFRDIGGYRTRQGHTVAWRRVFRSGEFARISENDFQRLFQEIKLASVVDLRSSFEVERHGMGLLSGATLKYHNIAFIPDTGDPESNERRFKDLTNLGDFYLYLVGEKDFNRHLIEALEIIAEPENQPLVFNCAVGKDRTGILAAILLSLLDVPEADIIADYALSAPYMEEMLQRIKREPPAADSSPPIPDVFWSATPESMALFLATLRREHGSIAAYLKAQGAPASLVSRLEKALLV
jgi:protein-tyrosine phosphatase